MTIREQIKRFLGKDDGSAAIEYGMIAGMATMAVVPMLEAMGHSTASIYFQVARQIDQVVSEIGKY